MIEEKEIICVVCPSSCHIKVSAEDGDIKEITGFTCKRGKEYARNEYLAPVRTLATTAKAKGYVSPVISVRTDKPVPKEKIMDCVEEIRKIEVTEPFYVGKVVIEDILGTGSNIILSNQ